MSNLHNYMNLMFIPVKTLQNDVMDIRVPEPATIINKSP